MTLYGLDVDTLDWLQSGVYALGLSQLRPLPLLPTLFDLSGCAKETLKAPTKKRTRGVLMWNGVVKIKLHQVPKPVAPQCRRRQWRKSRGRLQTRLSLQADQLQIKACLLVSQELPGHVAWRKDRFSGRCSRRTAKRLLLSLGRPLRLRSLSLLHGREKPSFAEWRLEVTTYRVHLCVGQAFFKKPKSAHTAPAHEDQRSKARQRQRRKALPAVNVAAARHSRPRYVEVSEVSWHKSRKDHNREVHALNGNTTSLTVVASLGLVLNSAATSVY